jgi:hypothetical protein
MLNGIIWPALLVALAVGIGAVVLLKRDGISMADPMGLPNWDFSQSWASTFTTVGAVLNGVISSQALPASPAALSRQSYAGLGVLFATLVVLAPCLYNFLRKLDRKAWQYHGRVWTFILAGVMTVWAALGQFATIAVLFDEIRLAGYLPDAPVRLLQSILVVGAVGLTFYALSTIRSTVEEQHSVKSVSGRTTPLLPWALL